MMGNMKCLRRSPVWDKVRLCLEKEQQIGPHFTLHCEEHQQTSHELSKLEERDFRFCASCNEATWTGNSKDNSVYVNIPRLSYDVFRCDLKPDFRRDYDRSDWHDRNREREDCFSSQCGARICGLLLASFTLCIFIALFWALSRPKI